MSFEDLPIEAVAVLEESGRHIAGGVVSLNRKVEPNLVFRRGKGSRIFDTTGKAYIDYHAAFAPHLLGHNFEAVNSAVKKIISEEWSLFGTGTNALEARLATLLTEAVPSLEKLQVTNTGSEATAHAIRLSRAFTGKDDILLVLGGYNGWHNEVARAVMPTLDQLGSRRSRDTYPFIPMSAGIPKTTREKVHLVNFNDLDSVEYAFKKFDIACVLTEPVLQNIGVVLPAEGYLEGLLSLCEAYGVICIWDEVKTGFRTALGGYQSVKGIRPHLSTFGKAVANGYPLGVIGGKEEILNLFDAADPAKKVLMAGTYNAHPVNVAAAIATLEILQDPNVYRYLDELSVRLYQGLERIFMEKGVPFVMASNASAFCVYFMEKQPVDLHDLLLYHDFKLDLAYRKALIEKGIYHIPIPCKQGSISFSHSTEDIEHTLEITREVVKRL